MFKVGEIVRIKKGFENDPQELTIDFEIVNVNEVTKRIHISPVVWNQLIKPIEVVGFDMVHKK